MATPTDQPPFGPGPQGQPAAQAAPGTTRSGGPPRVTHALAERHEALWLSLAALHKDIAALAAKKPAAPVSEPVRITAEGLLSDCVPFIRRRSHRLPVAAGDLAGLAVQLGQALAGLEAWEAANSQWRADLNAFVWKVKAAEPLPVMRLRPRLVPANLTGPDPKRAAESRKIRDKLVERIQALQRAARGE